MSYLKTAHCDICRVAITDVTNAVYRDSSSSVISQKPGGVVAVEAPVKADRWTEGRGGWREREGGGKK